MYMKMLRLAHQAFLVSFEFQDVVETAGPLDKDVVRRVDERDVAEIVEKVLEISPTSDIREVAKTATAAANEPFELFGIRLSA